MSLANDKVSHGRVVIAGNAQIAANVLASGFQNVVTVDEYVFGSGDRCERKTWIGEESPGSNYDSVASIGDEYIKVTFTSNAVTDIEKYIKTANGWEKILTANDADWFDLITVTDDTTAGANTWTIADLKGGFLTRDPAGADRSDVLPTAALVVAGITACAVGSSVRFHIKNTADGEETITLTAGSGGTLSPTTIKIGRGQTKEFLLVVTDITASSEAYTVYDLDECRERIIVPFHLSDADNETVGLIKMPAAGVLVQADFWTSGALDGGAGIDVIDGGADGSGTDVMVACTDALNGYESKTTMSSATIDSGDWINIKVDDITAKDVTVCLHIMLDKSAQE
jgi:hypothetical protein